MKTSYNLLALVVLVAISLTAGNPMQEQQQLEQPEFEQPEFEQPEFEQPQLEQYELPPEMDGVDFQQFEEEEGDEAEWMQEMDEDDDVDDEEPLTNIQSGCIRKVVIKSLTSGSRHADSDHSPYIHLGVKGKGHGSARFPDNPGDDMEQNKIDVWSIGISSFGFRGCVTKSAISYVYLTPGGNDGWKISWMKTYVVTRLGSQLLTRDNLNRWLDGNGPYSHRWIQLTLR